MRRILLYLLILLSAPCCAATYKLVTDASELHDGDVIIIGAADNLVMSTNNLSSNSSFDGISSFSSDNFILNPLKNTMEFTLEKSGSSWYLNVDGKYLAFSSSKSSNPFTITSKSSSGYTTKTSISIDANTHLATILFNGYRIFLSKAKTFKCTNVTPDKFSIKIYKRIDEQPSLVGCSEWCDNGKALEEWKNKTKDITLYRTFVADGGYYSLCLPFDVSQEQLKNVFGTSTVAFSFGNASIANGEYNVDLLAEIGTLKAGTPYIIKPSQTATNPVFKNVTITASTGNVVTKNQVSFNGVLDPFTMSDKNKFQRFLGGSDGLSLLYPIATAAIYPTRAYFVFPSENSAKIDFSNETSNGLDQVSAPSCTAKSYFTLDGRMLENKPTHDGIYIMDGHKVILHKR